MKLSEKHIAMIGVAVTAVGVVGALLYYRHAQTAASSADPGAVSSAQPYPFSPAVGLPSSYGGSNGPIATTPSVTQTDPNANNSGGLSPDLVALLGSAIGKQADNTAAQNYNSGINDLFKTFGASSIAADAAAGQGAPSYIAGSYSEVNGQPTFGFWTGPSNPLQSTGAGTPAAAGPVSSAVPTNPAPTTAAPYGSVNPAAQVAVTSNNPNLPPGVGVNNQHTDQGINLFGAGPSSSAGSSPAIAGRGNALPTPGPTPANWQPPQQGYAKAS